MTYKIQQSTATDTLGTYTSPNGAGLVFTTNTTAAPYWMDSLTINPGTTGTGVMQVKGDAEFEGDIKIKGKSLNTTLDKLEERLAILHPNERLEEKWENLRGLRKAYMELEAEIIEKEQIWSILKR
jgi:hypothetical protein